MRNNTGMTEWLRFKNFLSNLLSGLIAYSFFPKKPSLRMEDIIDNKQIANFA
jgi:hypothetical protein